MLRVGDEYPLYLAALEQEPVKGFRINTDKISVEAFEKIKLDTTIKKPRVGVVGEILVKFHPTANNNVVDIVESEGAEAVMPDLLDFLL